MCPTIKRVFRNTYPALGTVGYEVVEDTQQIRPVLLPCLHTKSVHSPFHLKASQLSARAPSWSHRFQTKLTYRPFLSQTPL